METKLCRTCKYMSSSCFFDYETLCVRSVCSNISNGFDWVTSGHTCQFWTQRPGEPLGSGISSLWMGSPDAWDAEVGYYHDLIVVNGQTPYTDSQWFMAEFASVGKLTWPKKIWGFIKSFGGYPVIRAWGILTGKSNVEKSETIER